MTRLWPCEVEHSSWDSSEKCAFKRKRNSRWDRLWGDRAGESLFSGKMQKDSEFKQNFKSIFQTLPLFLRMEEKQFLHSTVFFFLPGDCYINRMFILSAPPHRWEGHCRVESTYKPLGPDKKCHTDTSLPALRLQNNSPSAGFLNKLQICYPPKMWSLFSSAN